MTSRKSSTLLFGLLALSMVAGSGCANTGPSLGLFFVPIPVSPYFQKEQEDKHWEHERYERMPVLGPIDGSNPPLAIDEPSDDEVMRHLERARPVQGNAPFFFEMQRNNVRIVKEKIADYIDPPRVYPLIGPAQLHHSHWKCSVYFTEITRVGWPVPYTTVDEDTVEVLYIDHNHFHRVGSPEAGHAGL